MKYDQLEELLDEDLGWRKVEISTLLFIAKNSKEEVVLKAIILLLYAHWEGYIKTSSKLYIKFVSEKKIKISELCENFKAVVLKNKISRCIEEKDSLTLENEITFINKYLKLADKKFKVSIQLEDDFQNDIIDTQANLKPKVFKNIISILGLTYKKSILTREHYINSHLLANRNLIGHGSKYKKHALDFSLTIADVEKLKDIIFSIIDNFREELLEYVRNEYYLTANNAAKAAFETLQETVLEKTFADIESNYKA